MKLFIYTMSMLLLCACPNQCVPVEKNGPGDWAIVINKIESHCFTKTHGGWSYIPPEPCEALIRWEKRI